VADYRVIITLTYPHGAGFDGKESKSEFKRFAQELRREYGKEPCWSAFWVMEFQERGSIHYHILCTSKYISYKWIAKRWYDICGQLEPMHLTAGTSIESIKGGRAGIMAYMAKYAAKMEQKVVPEGFGWSGRFWGVIGLRKRLAAATSIPTSLVADEGIKDCLERIKGVLNEGEDNNTVVRIGDNTSGGSCYAINSQTSVANVKRLFQRISMIVAMKAAFNNDPLLDVTFDTGDDVNDAEYLKEGI